MKSQTKPSRKQVAVFKALLLKLEVHVAPMTEAVLGYCKAKARFANEIGMAAVKIHRVAKKITREQVEEAMKWLNKRVLRRTPKEKKRSVSSQLSQLWAPVKRNPKIALAWAKNGNVVLRPNRKPRTGGRKVTKGQLKRVVRQQNRVVASYEKLVGLLLTALKAGKVRAYKGLAKRSAKIAKQARVAERASQQALKKQSKKSSKKSR